MQPAEINHYAALGLEPDCTAAQIRAAYRLLVKQYHPDVNGDSRGAVTQTQTLNAAYAILRDPARRSEYDREFVASRKPIAGSRKSRPNITEEIQLRIEDFLRGISLEVRVNDPANPNGTEIYELIVPPDTAPGTRFRLPRTGGGFLVVRVKARPDFRFKVRGSDLLCDLRIGAQRALHGGSESLRGAKGNSLTVQIPRKVSCGEIIRLPGEGLPKARGGRGDLVVRVIYTSAVQVRRSPHR